MASNHRRDSPSSPPEGRPDTQSRPVSPGYSDSLLDSAPGEPDSSDAVHLIAESVVDYKPRLSLRLGPELTSRLQLAAFARRLAPESLAARLLIRGLDQEPDRIRAEAALAVLTPRERDVTRLTALGKTNPQIAYELGISGETVKSHIRRTLGKLGLHSKSDLRLLMHALDSWDDDPEALP